MYFYSSIFAGEVSKENYDKVKSCLGLERVIFDKFNLNEHGNVRGKLGRLTSKLTREDGGVLKNIIVNDDGFQLVFSVFSNKRSGSRRDCTIFVNHDLSSVVMKVPGRKDKIIHKA